MKISYLKLLPVFLFCLLAAAYTTSAQSKPEEKTPVTEAYKRFWKKNEILVGIATVSLMCVVWYAVRRKKKSNTANIDSVI